VLPITKVCFVDRDRLCRVVQRRIPGMKIAIQGQQHFMKRIRADLDLRDLKSTASTLHQSHSNISQSYSNSCSTTTRSSAGRLPCRSRAQHLMAFGCFHRRSQVVEPNASHLSGMQRHGDIQVLTEPLRLHWNSVPTERHARGRVQAHQGSPICMNCLCGTSSSLSCLVLRSRFVR